MDKKNILLVDDDSIANFLIEKVVAQTGLANAIYKALNGQEALNVFDQYINHLIDLPQVVLLDLNMPIMNGFEFLQAFQSLDFEGKKNVMIIVVSSSSNPLDIERVKSMGIKHYLTKPISAESIRNILQTTYN